MEGTCKPLLACSSPFVSLLSTGEKFKESDHFLYPSVTVYAAFLRCFLFYFLSLYGIIF